MAFLSNIRNLALKSFFTRSLCSSSQPDVLYRMVQLEMRGHDSEVIKSYGKFCTQAANELDITVGEEWEPFRFIRRRTLLRAAFVKKKKRVQYEWRTYFRIIQFKYLTGSTADTFLEYVERNIPEGMALRVTRHRLETLPEHLTVAPNEAAESQA